MVCLFLCSVDDHSLHQPRMRSWMFSSAYQCFSTLQLIRDITADNKGESRILQLIIRVSLWILQLIIRVSLGILQLIIRVSRDITADNKDVSGYYS